MGIQYLVGFLAAVLLLNSGVSYGQSAEKGNPYALFAMEMEASIIRPLEPHTDDERNALLEAIAPLIDYLSASPSEVPKYRLILLERGINRVGLRKVGVFDADPKVYRDYMKQINDEIGLFEEEIGQIQK
ncbi:MAG: hypothetical protein ISR47_04260 [Rhodospirillales bacterium]|nr:hypothetical protein [Rhodospirillales bacterium]